MEDIGKISLNIALWHTGWKMNISWIFQKGKGYSFIKHGKHFHIER